MRCAIVAERVFDADHILGANTGSFSGESASSVNDARTASRDYTGSLIANKPTPSSANVGGLKPSLVGTPDSDNMAGVSALLRVPGNLDGARWGFLAPGALSRLRGRNPAGMGDEWQCVVTGNDTTTRVSRPKLLPLANGKLLMAYLTANVGSGVTAGATGVSYRTWTESAGWGSATALTLPITVTGATARVIGADMIQMRDGEVFLFVGVWDGSTLVILRFRSVGTTIVFSGTACRYPNSGLTSIPIGLAAEVMDNGRIVLITQVNSSPGSSNYGLMRTYSSDRGSNFVAWKSVGQYATEEDFVGGGAVTMAGGVSLCKTRNGALLAVAPAKTGSFDSGGSTKWTNTAGLSRLRILVSEDGDSFSDMIRISNASSDPDSVTTISQTDGLFSEGINEGCVVVGDDGLPKIYGCLHGDSSGSHETGFYDEIVMLSMRKADITTADVGKQLSQVQAYAILAQAGAYVVTCSDAFEANYDESSGAYYATRETGWLSLQRCLAMKPAAVSSNPPSGQLTGTPVYCGPRFIEAVNFRGAIWLAVGTEDSGNDTTSITIVRTQVGSEVLELPGSVGKSNNDDFLKGRTYTAQFVAITEAGSVASSTGIERQGWSTIGAFTTPALDPTTGGLKWTSNTSVAYGYISNANVPNAPSGGAVHDVLMRGHVVPVQNGSVSADRIALTCLVADEAAAFNYGIIVRFLESGSIRVVDYHSGATLGTATGLGTLSTYGVEFKFRISPPGGGNADLESFFYRVRGVDPEDNQWQQLTLSGGSTLTQVAVGATVELIAFGHQTTDAVDVISSWRHVQFNRGATASSAPNYSKLEFNDYTTNTGNPPEFDRGSAWLNSIHLIAEWEDGLRHGTRPLLCSSYRQYLHNGLYLVWGGADGAVGDTWTLTVSNHFRPARTRQMPVRSFWRSADDDNPSYIVFYAGDAGEALRAEVVALFGVNAAFLKWQYSTDGSTWSPSVVIDPSDSADVRRDYFRRTVTGSNVVAEGNNRCLRFTDTTAPFQPHQFKSTDRRSWYIYSEQQNAVAKIVDNDDRRLFFDTSISGFDTNSKYIAIYPDNIAFQVVPGVAGYRYARLMIGGSTAEALPEGYQKVGLIIAGRKYRFDLPHPEWNYRFGRDRRVTAVGNEVGLGDRKKVGEASHFWEFAFSGMRARPDRENIAAVPGAAQGGYEELMDFLEAVDWGEQVFAFMPEYKDHLFDTASFGNRSFDVYPAFIDSDMKAVQQAYDCGRDDSLYPAFADVDAITIREAL